MEAKTPSRKRSALSHYLELLKKKPKTHSTSSGSSGITDLPSPKEKRDESSDRQGSSQDSEVASDVSSEYELFESTTPREEREITTSISNENPESSGCATNGTANEDLHWWRPNNVNLVWSANGRYCIVGLSSEESIVLSGYGVIYPLLGHVCINSHILNSSIENICGYNWFSPNSHGKLVLKSLEGGEEKLFFSHPHVDKVEPDILSTINSLWDNFSNKKQFASIVCFRSLDQLGLRNIEDISPDLRGVFKDIKPLLLSSEELQPSASTSFSLFSEPKDTLYLPTTWSSSVTLLQEDYLSYMKDPSNYQVPILCVAGGKNVGKSTFSKVAINTLLNYCQKVAYIDCDCGQSEFTPPGMVSLHLIDKPLLGPPFTHPKQPYHAFFTGSLTPRDNPKFYLECVKRLVSIYQRELVVPSLNGSSTVVPPLVINTQSWIHGSGYGVLKDILLSSLPTHLFEFHTSKVLQERIQETVDSLKNEYDHHSRIKHVHLQSYESSEAIKSRFHSSHHRLLSLASYFHFDFPQQRWSFDTFLTHRLPYKVGFQHVGIIAHLGEVAYSQILYALNGNVVGLVEVEGWEDFMKTTSTLPSTIPRFSTQRLPLDHRCHGLGIVRAIDTTQHQYLILTPTPMETLKKVNMLVLGDLQIPVWITVSRSKWSNQVYVSYSGVEGKGAIARRVRHDVIRSVPSAK